MKRLLIVTDSLGMPREETPIEKTWVDRTLVAYAGAYLGRALSFRNLTTKRIVDELPDLITRQRADVVLLQVGLCDCQRRALSARQRACVRIMDDLQLFFLTQRIREYCGRHHYALTKRKNDRYVPVDVFRANLTRILNEAKVVSPHCRILLVAIAPAGRVAVEKTYRTQEDIDAYNAVLQEVASETGAVYADPYEGQSADAVTLPADGQHLTDLGHALLTVCAARFLDAE